MAPLARSLRAALWAALVAGLAAGVHAQKLEEYDVKAAYLYGFGRFVEWPAAAPPAAGKAFGVCVIGADPFGRRLDEAVAGAVMKDKPVVVHRITQLEQSGPCHTLFISASEGDRLGRILAGLGNRPVLTVSDVPQFAQRGGMIGFTLDGSRVRFTVNLAAAHEAGLQMNSELLRVAVEILKSREPGN